MLSGEQPKQQISHVEGDSDDLISRGMKGYTEREVCSL